jgi:predicted O-linked N-acetylglucosamine transferase (SPINDLY family)
VIALWAGILRALPESRLILKARALGDEAVAERVRSAFAALGVGQQRIDCRGWIAEGSALAFYHEADIALDPFPYNGATTTCEALWMGVPVIALQGEAHAGRVGASLLAAAGLGDLAAASEADYARLAIALANDRERLQRLRAELREVLARGPLGDEPAFARALEGAFRALWRTWCEAPG